MLRGRGWLWLGIGSALVVGTTGCTLGIRASHGRNASADRTLTPEISGGELTGTVDESARSTEVVLGGNFRAGQFMTFETGMGIGTRTIGFEQPTGGLEMVKEPEDPDGLSNRGWYDAYYVGFSRALTGIDEMNVGVYGRAALTGLSRLAPGNSGTYSLEAGVEADLPTGEKNNRTFVRLGLALDGGKYELEMDNDIGRANGSTSFVALTAAIGVRLWGDR
jgi:hypothetical protein